MCWGDPGGWGGPAGDPGRSWRVLGGSRSCFGERAGELPDLFGPGGRSTETLANSQRVPRRGNMFEIWCLACLGLPITRGLKEFPESKVFPEIRRFAPYPRMLPTHEYNPKRPPVALRHVYYYVGAVTRPSNDTSSQGVMFSLAPTPHREARPRGKHRCILKG